MLIRFFLLHFFLHCIASILLFACENTIFSLKTRTISQHKWQTALNALVVRFELQGKDKKKMKPATTIRLFVFVFVFVFIAAKLNNAMGFHLVSLHHIQIRLRLKMWNQGHSRFCHHANAIIYICTVYTHFDVLVHGERFIINYKDATIRQVAIYFAWKYCKTKSTALNLTAFEQWLCCVLITFLLNK